MHQPIICNYCNPHTQSLLLTIKLDFYRNIFVLMFFHCLFVYRKVLFYDSLKKSCLKNLTWFMMGILQQMLEARGIVHYDDNENHTLKLRSTGLLLNSLCTTQFPEIKIHSFSFCTTTCHQKGTFVSCVYGYLYSNLSSAAGKEEAKQMWGIWSIFTSPPWPWAFECQNYEQYVLGRKINHPT